MCVCVCVYVCVVCVSLCVCVRVIRFMVFVMLHCSIKDALENFTSHTV